MPSEPLSSNASNLLFAVDNCELTLVIAAARPVPAAIETASPLTVKSYVSARVP